MISRIDDSWQEKGQWLAEGRNRKSAMFHNLGWKLLAFQLKPQSDGLYLVGRQEGDFRIVPSSIAVFGSILQYCSMDDGSYGHCAKKESSSNLGHIWIYLISSAKTGLIALICVDLLCWFYIYQKEICSGLGWFGWFSWSRNQVSRCFAGTTPQGAETSHQSDGWSPCQAWKFSNWFGMFSRYFQVIFSIFSFPACS